MSASVVMVVATANVCICTNLRARRVSLIPRNLTT